MKQFTIGASAVAICASLVGAQAAPRGRWIATWTASMFMVPPRNVQQVAGQTIRQVASITLGGDRVRIRLSNEYGDRPLKVGDAWIVLADTGATIIDESSRGITFGGRPSIVVGPGSIVVSDPVAWRIPAFASVAVFLYFPDTAFESTLAKASPQISYTSASGNFAAASRFPVEWGRAVWMFLTVSTSTIHKAAARSSYSEVHPPAALAQAYRRGPAGPMCWREGCMHRPEGLG